MHTYSVNEIRSVFSGYILRGVACTKLSFLAFVKSLLVNETHYDGQRNSVRSYRLQPLGSGLYRAKSFGVSEKPEC